MNETKWIPVEERLPDKDVDVMMSTAWGSIETGYYDYDDGEWIWRCDWCTFNASEVLAWMPLPEPYEPKEVLNNQ